MEDSLCDFLLVPISELFMFLKYEGPWAFKKKKNEAIWNSWLAAHL